MRYYNLVVSDPTSGLVWKPTSNGLGFVKSAGGSTFTSFVNGQTVPGALTIEFDIPVVPFHTPQGQASIRIWGIGLGMISQAANLNGAKFSLSAGMQKGLPLANPAQAGVVVSGIVFQAYGNWQGVNQTLDLICYPGVDQDVTFNWPKGTSLNAAIQGALSAAFPEYQLTVKIADSLKLSYDSKGHYDSLLQFAAFIQELTQKIGTPLFGAQYPGVQITFTGNAFSVFDNSTAPPPIQLAFQDLIGQPTWMNAATVSFKTVMRSDIAVGNQIQFPQGIKNPYALTTQAAAVPNAPASSKTAFQGTFRVNEVHHFANSRQPDADSWNSTFTAIATGTSNS